MRAFFVFPPSAFCIPPRVVFLLLLALLRISSVYRHGSGLYAAVKPWKPFLCLLELRWCINACQNGCYHREDFRAVTSAALKWWYSNLVQKGKKSATVGCFFIFLCGCCFELLSMFLHAWRKCLSQIYEPLPSPALSNFCMRFLAWFALHFFLFFSHRSCQRDNLDFVRLDCLHFFSFSFTSYLSSFHCFVLSFSLFLTPSHLHILTLPASFGFHRPNFPYFWDLLSLSHSRISSTTSPLFFHHLDPLPPTHPTTKITPLSLPFYHAC